MQTLSSEAKPAEGSRPIDEAKQVGWRSEIQKPAGLLISGCVLHIAMECLSTVTAVGS